MSIYDYIFSVAILKIAKLGHPVLIKKTNEINDLNKADLKKIVFDMSQTMLDANGIGLAAPQVHLSQRMFIYRNPEIEEEDKINISVFINPYSCIQCFFKRARICFSFSRNLKSSTMIWRCSNFT